MTARLLQETGGTLRTREGGKWAATLLTPGTGSSGVYAEEMLAEYAPKAFKQGMKLWWGHPKDDEGPGDRDARDQWGVLESDASYVPGEGVVGEIRLLPHWKDVVESLGDQASLSIYAMGESDENGNITALLEHFTNSVDIVSYPGREGSGLKKKLEAARAAFEKPGAASAQEHTQEESMDIKDVEALLDRKIEAAFKPFNDFLAEEATRRQAEADAKAKEPEVKDAVEAAIASVEAVKAAKLLPSLEKPLMEAAKNGADVTAGIEDAKNVMKEALEANKPGSSDSSWIVEKSSDGDDDDFALTRTGGGF